jgi:hypothetical protein
MRMLGAYGAAAIMTATILTPAAAHAGSTTGQLVYNFTYSANQSITARDSSSSAQDINTETESLTGGTNGLSHYGGTLDDKGTMTVAIIGKQPDGGLVVSISEAGQNVRRASAATCVVYGNTRVICDPNKTVYTEEYTLLRFLGPNFVDVNQLDASKHWAATGLNNPDMTVTADYTIDGGGKDALQIGETRKVTLTGAGHLTTNVQTKIGYDMSRTVPTTVDEYATQRTDAGMAGNSTTTYQTTLQLVSDEMAKQ